jgi:DNA polymerase-3 subunit chi
MPAIHFYHLTSTPLERALPKLLERTLAGGFNTLVLVDSDARLERLDQLLWTYEEGSFLPHAPLSEGGAPILLAINPAEHARENEILFITSGIYAENPALYARVIDMFDGNDPESLASARNRWKKYKDSGAEMVYNKQNEQGGWIKQGA